LAPLELLEVSDPREKGVCPGIWVTLVSRAIPGHKGLKDPLVLEVNRGLQVNKDNQDQWARLGRMEIEDFQARRDNQVTMEPLVRLGL